MDPGAALAPVTEGTEGHDQVDALGEVQFSRQNHPPRVPFWGAPDELPGFV